jgi:hypothetical protein
MPAPSPAKSPNAVLAVAGNASARLFLSLISLLSHIRDCVFFSQTERVITPHKSCAVMSHAV